MSSNIQMIPLDRLEHHPKNPRKEIGDVQELADSIKESGVLQNLTVVPHYGEVTGQPTGFYWVVIGNRRLEACQLAGLTEAPCVVVDMSPEEQFKTMMVENMQRCDLTPLEEADGFQLMIDDWGATVDSISRDTGLSQTTVRRRLTMASMDRKLVQKGLERGATIDDYMKLTKLKSKERREKCLKDIGTPNFKSTLAYQIEAEKEQDYLDQVEEELKTCGWCRKLEEKPPIKGWSYQQNYGKWNKHKVKKPADADYKEYGYSRGKIQIDLYRKDKKAENQEEERRKALHDKLTDSLNGIMNELDWEYQSFRDLREEFIDKFDRYNRCREEIMTMTAREFMRNDWSGNWREGACSALKIGWNSGQRRPDEGQLREMTKACPEKCLLWMAYLRAEGDCSKTWNRMWDSDIQATYPIFVRSNSLERLYKDLTELGYEMSKEEEAFIQGSCLQFEEAKAEIAKYKEEMEAWKI